MGEELRPGQQNQVTNWLSYYLGQGTSVYLLINSRLFLTLQAYHKYTDLFSPTDQQYTAFVEAPWNEQTTQLMMPDLLVYCASCLCPSPTSNLRQQSWSWASLWCPWQPHLLMLKCYRRFFFFSFLEQFWNELLMLQFLHILQLMQNSQPELTSLNPIKFSKTHHLKADLCILTD